MVVVDVQFRLWVRAKMSQFGITFVSVSSTAMSEAAYLSKGQSCNPNDTGHSIQATGVHEDITKIPVSASAAPLCPEAAKSNSMPQPDLALVSPVRHRADLSKAGIG